MRIKLTLAMLLSFMTGFAQNYTPKSPGKIVNHSSYSLAYSEQHEQAIWVLYHLTPDMINGTTGRSDDFRPDPKVSRQSASLEDYKGSGYDRGHLCPAADMKQSSTAMSETFYLSNMSPQVPGFNRGIWKNLEETVRKWSLEEDGIWVVTGAIFRDNKGTIGKNKVTVPGYYYKIIYDYSGEEKMIALILPNSEGKKQLSDYVVSVDRVEELTEVDFFPQLDDAVEEKLEAQSNPGKWSFNRMVVQVKVQQKLSTPVQCTGTTKSGNRCKNKTYNTNGCCHLHQSQAGRSSL